VNEINVLWIGSYNYYHLNQINQRQIAIAAVTDYSDDYTDSNSSAIFKPLRPILRYSFLQNAFFKASRLVMARASVSLTSTMRSTFEASKILGKYSFGHLRIPEFANHSLAG
jgi:hypothetical protein